MELHLGLHLEGRSTNPHVLLDLSHKGGFEFTSFALGGILHRLSQGFLMTLGKGQNARLVGPLQKVQLRWSSREQPLANLDLHLQLTVSSEGVEASPSPRHARCTIGHVDVDHFEADRTVLGKAGY